MKRLRPDLRSADGLGAVVATAREALFALDPDGTILFWNPASEETFGYPEAEAVGMPIATLVASRFQDAHRADLARAFAAAEAGRGEATSELVGVRKDGSEFPLELSVSVGTHAGDRFCACIARDLTGSDRRFRALLEAAPDAMLAVDRGGRVVHANAQVENLFGHPRAALFGEHVAMLVPERLRRAFEAYRERCAEAASTADLAGAETFVGLRKDGAEFPVEISLATVGAGGGALTVAAIRDVTARRAAEVAVREERDRFATVLSAQSDLDLGVAIAENDRYVYVNEANARILGYTVEELLALPSVLAIVAPEEQPRLAERRAARLRGEPTPELGEVIVVHKSGRRLHVEYSIKVLHVGDRTQLLTVMRDVTERLQMQARMIIADRLASVGTLAAGIAHEINNPLAYVTANLDLVVEELRARDPGSPTGRATELETLTNEARQGAERIRQIVRGLRTFSRADEERRVQLDVREVLETAINMCFNELKHRARLVKDYGSVSPVEADETRLAQVFINLLVNAAQAIPEGHAGRNEIRVVTRADAAGRVVVEVMDTGQGIPEAHVHRIFEPFFTTKDVGQGTGLGLSICHGIITALGGEIAVDSVLGRGTTFRVVLPAAKRELVEAQEAPRESPRPAAGRRGQVLIVDDDPLIGATIARVLRKEHDVRVVSDGRQALELLTSGERFDVVLCDLMMPGMTGMDLHGKLMRTAPDLTERLVFLTGGAFTPAARAFLDDVPNQRLEKPFAPQNLRAIVRALVG